MDKLTVEQVSQWVKVDERFEMRGDSGSLCLVFRTRYKSPGEMFLFRQFDELHK